MHQKKMISIIRIIMISISIACIIIFSPWDGIWAAIQPLPDTVQAQIDHATGLGLDGIIVYVDQAGHPATHYSAGWKNRTDQTPADPQSLFKIASISKLYVAVATAKLAYAQRLSLDDTLTDYFPALTDQIQYADQITLRMLVQHRSGIPNFTAQPGFRWDDPTQSSKESLALIAGLPAEFDPGTDYQYCNTNYLLLGDVLDQVLNDHHSQYIRDEILTPLGLDNTYFSLDEVDMDDVASGYYMGTDKDFKHIETGMLATAEDVGIFLRALNDGSLLNTDEQAIYSSIYEHEHTGWVMGYYSIARYHADIDTIVVQFVNTNGGTPLVPVFDTQGGTKVMVSNTIYDRIIRILHR